MALAGDDCQHQELGESIRGARGADSWAAPALGHAPPRADSTCSSQSQEQQDCGYQGGVGGGVKGAEPI